MSTRDEIRLAKEKLDQVLSHSSDHLAASKIDKDTVDSIVKAAERLSKAEQERRWNWQAVATPITMLSSIVAIVLSTLSSCESKEAARKSADALEKQTHITRAESAVALALEHSKILYGDNVATQTWSTALQQIQTRANNRQLRSVADGLAVINDLVLAERRSSLTIPVEVPTPSDPKKPSAEQQAQDIASSRIQDVAAVQPRVAFETTSNQPLKGKLVFCQGFNVPEQRRTQIASSLEKLGATTFPWQTIRNRIPNEIRYYFPADRAAAVRVSETIGGGSIPRVVQVTKRKYVTKAKPGLIEVWLNETVSIAASAAAP